jgi:hypothetical protein
MSTSFKAKIKEDFQMHVCDANCVPPFSAEHTLTQEIGTLEWNIRVLSLETPAQRAESERRGWGIAGLKRELAKAKAELAALK